MLEGRCMLVPLLSAPAHLTQESTAGPAAREPLAAARRLGTAGRAAFTCPPHSPYPDSADGSPHGQRGREHGTYIARGKARAAAGGPGGAGTAGAAAVLLLR